ncbi:MAG: D-alanine--D-alanine ligase [Alphaproteobacteria bacterium]
MKRVAVLMGGRSAEREVSLASGKACAAALRRKGYDVSEVDVNGGGVEAVLAALTPRPDVAVTALHGRFGEDGCVQGLLELMGVPYTHSGVLASALAMDKPASLAVFRACGIRVPEGRVAPTADAHKVYPAPYVVKPPREGSSVGVTIVREGDNRPPVGTGWAYGDEALVERYVPGRELTVAVMNDRPLGMLEIVSDRDFYDYDAKYAPGGSVHVAPENVGTEVVEAAKRVAVEAHRALGCRGVSRADFRWDDRQPGADGLYLLEVNTQPGMTETSLVPEIAENAGISFADLVAWMVEDARCGR